MKGLAMSDDQLIFLISLPRSGSTMIQKMLGSHSNVYTRSEPWLMLNPLHALKEDGIEARYNSELARKGVKDFLSGLPEDGEEFYYLQLRKCYLELYGEYLKKTGRERFLDKTPRYYEIFDELQRVFPEAKYILLYRNPLAVLSSMLATWVKGQYENINNFRGDLIQGVEFLQRDFASYSNVYRIRYEDVVGNPEKQLKDLFLFLDLPYQQDCIQYGKSAEERWQYGDPVTVYKNDRPQQDHADAWIDQLDRPEYWKLVSDYLQKLGRDSFEKMGYSFDEAESDVSKAWQQYPQVGSSNLSLYNYLRNDKENLARARSEKKVLGDRVEVLQKKNLGLEEKLEQVSQNLKEKDQALIKVQCQRDESESKLDDLLSAIEDLTRHKALLSPILKMNAYRNVLYKYVTIKADKDS